MNGCYKLLTDKEAWDDSAQGCRSLHEDAHLLVIDDEEEQSTVADMLESSDGLFTFCCFTRISQVAVPSRVTLALARLSCHLDQEVL